MPRVTINSIWGGIAPARYFVGDSQYLAGIGIDPDLPISDAVGDKQTSGAIRPAGYSTFSGATLNDHALWLMTTPKTSLLYAYLKSGRLLSYDSSFGSETNIGTPTSGVGNGLAYYNNYAYLSTPTDVARYGPLDGAAALTNTVWSGATLGSQTALVNWTAPSLRGSGVMPNHVLHPHIDNKLYILDFDSTSVTVANRGRGLIHFIKTKYGSAEGDTNDVSTYNALDLPLGFMPVCSESYGTDIVVGAIQTTNSTFNQGRAALFFWDTLSSSFRDPVVWLADPLVTALRNVNGNLYVFSGPISTGSDVSNGFRVSLYGGGYSLQQVYFSDVGAPPLHGAVDSFGDRLAWGGFTQIPSTTAASPEYYAGVFALGSKNQLFSNGVHFIINSRATATAADGLVTALKNVQQASYASPRFVLGWRDSGAYGLDKQGTTYGTTIFRSQIFNVNQPFALERIRFSLPTPVATNMTITPKFFIDDFSSSSTNGLKVINTTNYPAAKNYRNILQVPKISGNHNFCLELRCTGTVLLPVLLPIQIDFKLLQDTK